jgi:sigma-B regulation protein RsbU (phosphoserine phosphatase)
MLALQDIYHLPELEPIIDRLVSDGPGLVVVSGLDPRQAVATGSGEVFLPSGRASVFRMLMRQMITADASVQAILVAEDQDAVRIPRSLRPRVRLSLVQPPDTYAHCIGEAAASRPDLLVIDRLAPESAAAALRAARGDLRVLAQLDSVFRGEEVVRHVRDMGVAEECLGGLAWVLAVQRLPALCSRCKEEAPPTEGERAALQRLFPALDISAPDAVFCRASGCSHCRQTGREGEVAVFDVYQVLAGDAPAGVRRLSLERYLFGLAARGMLPLDDLLHLEADHLRRTYNLLAASERALAEANLRLRRNVEELEAAQRVLQQRTEALISLERIGHALITSTRLDELAAQLCHRGRELCRADRAILYYLGAEQGMAEILAVSGWDTALVHQPVEAPPLIEAASGSEPTPFNHWPPGVPRRPTDLTAATLRAGLCVPLVAQERQVGLMMVHTSRRDGFEPGQTALLQTFAHQAALALQRAGLTEALQEKVVQLQVAQAELIQKERMERELELARQVQQSMLPRVFPLVPGYAFAACNEPARWVGGDFYDVILLDAERFGIVVADVSDKGMPAALYMALTRSLLLAEARRESSPCAVLSSVHTLLLELGQPTMFVTVFYGVVDGPTQQLTFARAGHDRPLLLRDGQAHALGGDGTILGFPGLQDLHLSEERIDLMPRDRLVLYTDGLTDSMGPDARPFGRRRLTHWLQSHADLPAAELCAATFSALNAYRGTAEQYDDMTMLVVQVRSRRASPST